MVKSRPTDHDALEAAKRARQVKATTAASPKCVTQKQLLRAFEQIGGFVAGAIKPLVKRIEELEARSAPEYGGVWETGKAYAKGESVTFGGSLWIARQDHPGTPGKPGSNWTLAVKRGRDAR